MSDLPLASEFPSADDRAWRALVDKALKGTDFDNTLVSRTYDGLEIRPLYTREDEARPDPAGIPGSSPYTRGFRANHGDPPWHIRQLHGQTDLASTNAAILEDLGGGVTAIALRIAAPGQSGLILSSPADLDTALAGVALDLAGVWIEAGHGSGAAVQMLCDVWSAAGIDDEKAIGGWGANPIGTMAITGGLPVSLEQGLEEAASLAKRSLDQYPNVTAIQVDARPWHGGGGSEAEELACMCATLAAYLRALEGSGLSPRDALAQMEFSLACDQDFFANIAKLRAARALIARIADVSGALDSVAGLKLHAMTSFRMFARRDPQVNILRTTISCAAAALGGADSITVLPYTFANGAPDDFARRIARNIQIILQEESSLGAVIDPAGGSWYVEDFSRNLAGKSWEIFQEIEKQGGMAEALLNGFVQKMLIETAKQRAKDVAHSELELTGVSAFSNLNEKAIGAAPHPQPEEFDDPAITVEPVPLRRPAEPFERLRDASDVFAERTGSRPKIVLVTLGKASDHAARATYAESFFAAGGVDTVPAASRDMYSKEMSPIVCLCSSDDIYAADGIDAVKTFKNAGAEGIYAVGRPGELREALRKAGVDEFLHRGCDMIKILETAHDVLGLRQ